MNTLNKTLKPLITTSQIEDRVTFLAEKINKTFGEENELVAICVLKGAVMFYTKLLEKLDMPVKMEFIKISTYGDALTSSQEVKTLEISSSLNLDDKNVLIVEDIVDTGYTLKFLKDKFEKEYKIKTLKTVSLLNKNLSSAKSVSADFIGFDIEDKFVVGYGLDYKGYYRNLPYVAILQQ